MRINKMFFLLLTVLILALAFQTYQLIHLKKKYNNLTEAAAPKNEPGKEIEHHLREIASLIVKDGKSFEQITGNTMKFVHNNSVHSIDQERDSFLYKMSLTDFLAAGSDRLLQAHSGQGEKPSLSCGLRSLLMKAILDRFGLKSRLVQIYSDSNPDFSAHRLLEVQNPNNSSWELWDPDYNVRYINSETKEPVNGVDFVFMDPNLLIPQRGGVVGWDATNASEVKGNFRGAIMFENENIRQPGSIIYLNLSLFDPQKTNFNGMSFEEFSRRAYAHARVIVTR